MPISPLSSDQSAAPPSGNERARNIVQGMGSLTAQNLATSVLAFLFLAALLRLLPADQYGVYSGVLVATNIGGTFASFGLNLAATRYIALLREQDEPRSWVAARKILVLALVFSTAVSVVYLVISPSLSLYFTKSSSWTWLFFLGSVWLFFSSISNTCQGIIQGLKKYVQLAKILFVTRLVMVVFTVGVLLVDRNVGFAVVAWIIYGLLTVGWTLGLIGRKLLGGAGSFEYSSVLRYSFPLGIASIIAVFSTTADVVVVGGYLNPVSLGVYNAAITISGVLSVVLIGPLTTTFLPEVSSSLGGEMDVSNGMRLALRFVTLAVLPASLLVAAQSPQLLGLFSGGGRYLAGSLPLGLVASFYVFLAIEMVTLVLLQAVGKTLRVMVVGGIAAAVDVGVAILLVPELGLVGAALSKVSVGLIGMFVATYVAKEYMRNLDRIEFYLKGALSAAIPFAVIMGLSLFVSTRVITLVPYTLIYAFIFLLCVKAFKLLSDEDRAFLAHTLPVALRRFLKYI